MAISFSSILFIRLEVAARKIARFLGVIFWGEPRINAASNLWHVIYSDTTPLKRRSKSAKLSILSANGFIVDVSKRRPEFIEGGAA